MNKFSSFAAGACYLARVSALDGNASYLASTSPEQYCFPKFGGPFPSNGTWPYVTIIYQGNTLTTTPVAAIGCQTVPNSAIARPIETSAPLNGFSSLGGTVQSASANLTTTDIKGNASHSATILVPGALSDGGNASTQSLVPMYGSLTSNLFAGSFSTAASDSGTGAKSTTAGSGISRSLATPDPNVSTTALLNLGVASGTTAEADSSASVSSIGNRPSEVAGAQSVIASISANVSSPESGVGSSVSNPQGQSPSTAVIGTVAQKSTQLVSISVPTQIPSEEILGGSNNTVQLPVRAVESLQLAQFLKNLGVSVFNASSTAIIQNATTSRLASVVANISMQEHIQHKALADMLSRTGNVDIPPCNYRLPNNTTDLYLLMSTLKSIEVSAFMSLAESLPSDATSATILLSSIAGIAARQNAMLQAYAQLNTSTGSFETPLSATWAYNLALNYVQPGSCSAELPIPILPTLSIQNSVIGHTRPNDTVTFQWDDAGRAAAARSGRSLYIGWVNQVDAPVYTLLDAFGDGSGTTIVPHQLSGTAFAVLTTQPGLLDADDLTEATLAGPVVVGLMGA